MRHQFREQLDVGDGVLVLAADLLLIAIQLLLGGLDVREDEFGLDHPDVADRVDLAHAVDDIVVIEAANHMDDGVALADVGEEVVAFTLSLGGPGDETGDIDDVDGGGDDDLRAGDLLQRQHAVIGDEHDAHVGLDRAEGVVGRLRLAGAGQGVEEGGLAHVGESDDTSLSLCHGKGTVGIRPAEVKSREGARGGLARLRSGRSRGGRLRRAVRVGRAGYRPRPRDPRFS